MSVQYDSLLEALLKEYPKLEKEVTELRDNYNKKRIKIKQRFGVDLPKLDN